MANRASWPTRVMSSFRRKLNKVRTSQVTELAAETPIEEELTPCYKPEFYFPVDPGYVFHNRYEAVAKLGWGSCSTVWLARDICRKIWQSERYVALKIGNCDFKDAESAAYELKVERRIAQANDKYKGFSYVRTCIDSFQEKRPHGTHLCLVYEPMREPLWLFQQRFRRRKFPLALLKGYVKLLLQGLDYLHSECNVIHTDLKTDNILVGFENSSVVKDFALAQAANPMPRKVKDGRSIYLSRNDFGPLRSYYILPKITDFGLAHLQDDPSQLNRHPIQPDHYRAPEVVLGAGWSYSADIWNLGVLMWNLLENRDLFSQIHDQEGKYSARAHLAEMIALFGPPPKELLDREKDGRRWNFAPAIQNSAGKVCTQAYEWYGGPFFDDTGKFLYEDLIPHHLTLENTVTSLQGEDRRLFIEFAAQMLQWHPDDRKSAKDLLEDPWLSEEPIRRGD